MTDHSKYNNGFTAGDFERYHNGSMSPLEMHQLEKAAMEDPFLADALEGYEEIYFVVFSNDKLLCMKIVLIIIICFISLSANAMVYDTLGFKVNVPKISKADDKAVGIQITFDTVDKKSAPKNTQRNIKRATAENELIDKLIAQANDSILFHDPAYYNRRLILAKQKFIKDPYRQITGL